MRNVAEKMWRDLMGSEPGETAVRDWARQLEEGAARSTLASCLLHSDESRERTINQFYHQYLGRAPEPTSLRFWVDRLGQGESQEEILTALLSGEEYFQKNGGNNGGFVRALFRDLFKRFPSAAEVEGWATLLSSHLANRRDLAQDFLSHEEHKTLLLKTWFWLFLRRLPDESTIREWIARWTERLTRERVQIEIICSSEYLFTVSATAYN